MAVGVVPRSRRGGRALLPLGLLFFAIGVSGAVVEPFRALFLSTAVRASPVQLTVFLIVAPLSGVVAATLVGRLSDRRAIRRELLVATSVAGLVGMGLTAFVRDYWALLALTATATALAGALFPQALAYARQHLTRGGASAAMGISTLRTVFSASWVAGPPLAAILLRAGGFASIFVAAAAMYVVAALIAVLLLHKVDAPLSTAGPAPDLAGTPSASRSTLLRTAAAFTLLQCPMTLCVQALPLYIDADLGGDATDAGLILGLCAALEIPLMLSLGVLASRIRIRVLVLAGAGCGVAYYAFATITPSVWALGGAQILNAAFIAAVAGLGISYMQDMLPEQPGRVTTLFINSFPVGAMLAGPLFGLSQRFGYRYAFLIASALCLAGLLVLLATDPRGRSRLSSPRPSSP
ncbi:sugar efflux transporter [Phytohabitans houttuyneae]|uniref:sugar efflux transporter n=1 Tax=Phytohabitans houttuyneae TaxID=1076126 RepID=UPI0015648DDA|nr:sugar efflux transporter [Phytohabitans houttuyneae]